MNQCQKCGFVMEESSPEYQICPVCGDSTLTYVEAKEIPKDEKKKTSSKEKVG